MKKTVILSLIALVVTAGVTYSAETLNAGNMGGLDHWRYYTWGISMDAGQQISQASLTFTNIRNWNSEENILFIQLLDGPNFNTLESNVAIPLGVKAYGDTNDAFHNAFGSQGVQLATWSDTNPDNTPETVVIDLSDYLDQLNSYAADGFFALGFDPDCHFWNDGVSLTYSTSVVPAPGAVSLGAIGIALIGWLRKRKTV